MVVIKAEAYMKISNLTVACKMCSQAASFEFANVIEIKDKTIIQHLTNSKHFDVLNFKGWGKYKRNYYAIHYPGINPRLENIKNLPEKCQPEHWQQGSHYPNIVHYSHYGVLRCNNCDIISKHVMEWPDEAFFSNRV